MNREYDHSFSGKPDSSEADSKKEPTLEEFLSNEEHYVLNEGVVVGLSGLSGSFKSTSIIALQLRCRLPEAALIGIGDIVRSAHKIVHEKDILGAVPRPFEKDITFDAYILARAYEALAANTQLLIEGRLAPFLIQEPHPYYPQRPDDPHPVFYAAEGYNPLFTREAIDPNKVLGVLIFVTDPAFRHRGIKQREANHKRIVTLEEVARATQEREENDRQQWRDLYGIEDPFYPDLMTSDGRRVYDKVVKINPQPDEKPNNFSYAIDISHQIGEALVAKKLARRESELNQGIPIFP